MPNVEPDCVNCIQYTTCERAQAGTFCQEFRSTPLPEYDATQDPNALWAHGEDADFQED